MKLFILITVFFIGCEFTTNACCAEYNERYVPLGEVNEELYMLEVKFHRNCRGKDALGYSDDNQFYITGIVNILKYADDDFIVADSLLKFHEIECYCTFENFKEKTKVDSLLNNYFQIAIGKMEKRPLFVRSVRQRITFNDSSNYTLHETDTALWFKYKLEFDYYYPVDEINIWKNMSSQEPNLIAEKRIYSTENFKIEIIQLSSEFITQDQQKSITKDFDDNISFWSHNNLWHGVRRDVVYLSNE